MAALQRLQPAGRSLRATAVAAKRRLLPFRRSAENDPLWSTDGTGTEARKQSFVAVSAHTAQSTQQLTALAFPGCLLRGYGKYLISTAPAMTIPAPQKIDAPSDELVAGILRPGLLTLVEAGAMSPPAAD